VLTAWLALSVVLRSSPWEAMPASSATVAVSPSLVSSVLRAWGYLKTSWGSLFLATAVTTTRVFLITYSVFAPPYFNNP
jgi:hypothetical protein